MTLRKLPAYQLAMFFCFRFTFFAILALYLGYLYQVSDLKLFLHRCSLYSKFTGCQFYPLGEYLRFIRVPENLKVGDKVVTLEIHSKHNLTLESIDKVS